MNYEKIKEYNNKLTGEVSFLQHEIPQRENDLNQMKLRMKQIENNINIMRKLNDNFLVNFLQNKAESIIFVSTSPEHEKDTIINIRELLEEICFDGEIVTFNELVNRIKTKPEVDKLIETRNSVDKDRDAKSNLIIITRQCV